MGLSTLGLLGVGERPAAVAVLLAIWGAMNTVMSIAWMTWLSQNVDDAPEAAGSLIVAAIQAAILLGAAFGGSLLDHLDIQATFLGSVALSVVSLMLIGGGRRLLEAG